MPKYEITATVRVVLNMTVTATVHEHDDEDDAIRDEVAFRLQGGLIGGGDPDVEITNKGEPVFASI